MLTLTRVFLVSVKLKHWFFLKWIIYVMNEDKFKDWVTTILVCGVLGYGYVMNFYKLTQCDFLPPYKAEFIHALGLVTPVGFVAGYLDIGEFDN